MSFSAIEKYIISCVLWEPRLPERAIQIRIINLSPEYKKLCKTFSLNQNFFIFSSENNIQEVREGLLSIFAALDSCAFNLYAHVKLPY